MVLLNAFAFDNVGGVVALIVILVRLLQPWKALLPIVVTPLPIVTLERLLQPENLQIASYQQLIH